MRAKPYTEPEVNSAGYSPTRWWRAVLLKDASLWAESSDEDEIRRHAKNAPSPARVQRLMERVDRYWEDVPG